MARTEASQPPPEPGQDLQGFPRRTIEAGALWHRAHRAMLGPWFFSHQGHGRFDLTEPDGTCYVANTAAVAARELIGPDLVASGAVPEALLAGRVVSRIPLPTEVKVASLTSNEALTHRVTGELSAMSDYTVPQAWAGAFREHGFGGVWYQPRFSPGKGRALGIFGPAGAGECEPLDRLRLRDVVDQMSDVRVVQTSSRNDYEILEDPQ